MARVCHGKYKKLTRVIIVCYAIISKAHKVWVSSTCNISAKLSSCGSHIRAHCLCIVVYGGGDSH